MDAERVTNRNKMPYRLLIIILPSTLPDSHLPKSSQTVRLQGWGRTVETRLRGSNPTETLVFIALIHPVSGQTQAKSRGGATRRVKAIGINAKGPLVQVVLVFCWFIHSPPFNSEWTDCNMASAG